MNVLCYVFRIRPVADMGAPFQPKCTFGQPAIFSLQNDLVTIEFHTVHNGSDFETALIV